MNRPAAALAAVGLSLGLAGLVAVQPRRPSYLPDPGLTPGAVKPGVTSRDTCDPGYSARTRRDLPDRVKDAILRAYGLPATPAARSAVEFDHRVPLSLGGADWADHPDRPWLNLWPEPWDGPKGARAKDRLEFHLYKAVCRGEVTLAEAQAIFRGDWTASLGRIPPARVGATADGAEDFDAEGFDAPRD